jgi:hypothetical protein
VQVLNSRHQIGAQVVVVSFAAPALLRLYRREQGLDEILLFSDEDRAAYAAFGFGRAGVGRVWLDPRVWRAYAALLARGRRTRSAQGDTLQLGGDVLVDAEGIVTWIHRSQGPEDRPSITEVLAACRFEGRPGDGTVRTQ